MAAIARVQSLLDVLSSPEVRFGPQVWVDPQLGLVGGVYPTPRLRFDFAAERALEVVGGTGHGPDTTSDPTQPEARKEFISLLHHAKRVGQEWEVETHDTIYRLGSATQALIHGLDLIEEARPGTLETLSRRKKQSKRPVARTHEALYDVPHPEAHSARLKSGWFVATNNKAAEARGVLRQAAEIAGLTWGVDFDVRRV